ncbi:hypothetical protein V4Y02_23560, partial [Escherichia coli]
TKKLLENSRQRRKRNRREWLLLDSIFSFYANKFIKIRQMTPNRVGMTGEAELVEMDVVGE